MQHSFVLSKKSSPLSLRANLNGKILIPSVTKWQCAFISDILYIFSGLGNCTAVASTMAQQGTAFESYVRGLQHTVLHTIRESTSLATISPTKCCTSSALPTKTNQQKGIGVIDVLQETVSINHFWVTVSGERSVWFEILLGPYRNCYASNFIISISKW